MRPCLALLIGTALLLPATRASAQELSAVHATIRSVAGADAFCMDADHDRQADQTPVNVWRCHGRRNQRWTVTTNSSGGAAIIGTGGFCLDTRGRHSRADGTPVQLWRCHFGPNQRYFVTADGHIQEVASGKCLQALAESDGAPVVLDECGNNPWQIWQLVE